MDEGDPCDPGPQNYPPRRVRRWFDPKTVCIVSMSLLACGNVWHYWDQKGTRNLSLDRTIAELRTASPEKARPLIGQATTLAGAAIDAIADAQSLGGEAGCDAAFALCELAKRIEKRRAH